MQANNHDLIITGIHMDLTDSLKQNVTEKAERLFRHEDRIIRIKVELECDHTKSGADTNSLLKGTLKSMAHP